MYFNIKRLQLHRFWLLLLVSLAILAAALLAAGLSNMPLRPGQPFPLAGILQLLNESSLSLPTGLSIPAGLIYVLTGCFWVILFISIVAFIISPEVRKHVFRRVIIYLVWFLLFFGLIRALQPYLPLLQPQPQSPAQSGQPADQTPAGLIPAPPEFVVNPPGWLVIAASILIVAVPLIIFWLLWRFFWAAKAPAAEESPLETLTAQAQRALDELEAGENLKDTVLRCYRQMNKILSQRYNIRRAQGMTAREFEQFLAHSGFQNEHIRRLTRLFERVRYSNQSPHPTDEQEAVACLTAIVNHYGRPS